MNKRFSAILLMLVFALVLKTNAQEKVYLVPDRTSCASGDTIWFTTMVFNRSEEVPAGNVVHVQLDKLNGKHVTRVNIVSQGVTGDGYLPVPDSLSTGIYVLKAFTNVQTDDSNAIINQRLVTVYNRFDTDISTINYPEVETKYFEALEGVEIHQNNHERENNSVEFTINLPEEIREDLEEMIVIARLKDPMSDSFSSGFIATPIKQKALPFMAVPEKNGLLIKGKVIANSDESEVEGATILLSISDTLPYFDFCITDSHGRFSFYLRNAYGTANLIVQELSNNPGENRIVFDDNFIETPGINASSKILNNEERSYSDAVVKSAYFDKFFKSYTSLSTDTFSLSSDFEYPFYGKPTNTFYPELFIDLPDFQEISREILRGVQYRNRKEEVSIRLFDHGTQNIFNNEPFKLLDGVPVFDPDIFTDMGTTDIKKVDAVFYKHYFGDISFDGVLAVYTHHPTLTWVENLEGVNVTRYQCLQPELKWDFSNSSNKAENTPDFKKVFFRKKWKNVSSSETISFNTSNIKGDLVLELIVVNRKQEILQHHEIFQNN
ncbi:hypothetical protein [Maribellus mangrovi]|uniref:hypothetical protein n=1 Tax=Maribellus mangrovi TaxID=3133146 RepID=UPI0030EDBC7F